MPNKRLAVTHAEFRINGRKLTPEEGTLANKVAGITRHKTLKEVGGWLDNWWEVGRGGKQNWYELEAFIQALKGVRRFEIVQ